MEFKKYGWDDFFSFNDETPLNKFDAGIDQLQNNYLDFTQVVIKSNQKIVESQKQLIDQAKVVLSTVDGLQMAQSGSSTTMEKAAKSTSMLAGEMKILKDVESENIKKLSESASQLDKLSAAKEKASKATAGESNSLKALKAELDASINKYKSFGDATEASVKQATLKRIKELSEQTKSAGDALTVATKSAKVAAGSYNELNAQVNSAKKALKDMSGGLDDQSDEFKELQKFVADNTDKLKEWDKAINDNKRNVGNYEGSMKALKDELKATRSELIGIAATLGTDSKEFIEAAEKAGALKDQISDVNDAVKNTEQSKFENLSTSLGDVGGKLKNLDFAGAAASAKQFAAASKAISFKDAISGFKDFGKTITTVGKAILTNPLFLIAAIVIGIAIAIYKLRDSVIPLKIAFEAVGASIDFVIGLLKDLGDWLGLTQFALEEQTRAIVENAKKQIAVRTLMYDRMIELAEAEGKAVLDLERIKLKTIIDFSQRAINALKIKQKTVLGLNDDEKKDLLELTNAYEDAYQQLRVLNAKTVTQYKRDAEEKLKAERAALLEVRKMRLQSALENQESIIKNDQAEFDDRLKAVLRAEQIRNKLIALEREKAIKESGGIVYKEVLAREEASRQIIASAQKREDALVLLLDNATKKRLEIFKRNTEAIRALDNTRLAQQKWINDQILADDESSLADRLSALMDNSDIAQTIIESNSTKELAAVRDAAMARVVISQESYDAIYANAKLSEEERIAMLLALKQQELANDEAYQNDVIRITEDTNNKIIQLNLDTAKAAEENVFKILARDAERWADGVDTLAAEALLDLNQQLEDGNISAERYQFQRQQIEQNGQRASIEGELQYYIKQRKLLEESGKDLTDIDRQIAEARLALSDQTAEGLLDREQRLNEAMAELRQGATDTAFSILQSGFESEQMALDARSVKLKENLDLELALAGDNEEKKNELQNRFALENQKLESQKAALARRTAVFERVQALFTIGVNTAVAVSKAVAASPLTGGLPFSAIAAALGALQIAAVLAKPIPSYAEGTMYHGGGLALFGEAGPEIVQRPDGHMSYHAGPTLDVLPTGTKVYNAEQTAHMLNANAMMAQSYGQYAADNDRLGTLGDAMVYENMMAEMLSNKLDSLEYALKSKKELHINITKKGVQKMIKSNDDWTEYLNRNYY